MELTVKKIDGTESGKKVVLDEKVFGIEPNDHAIYLDVLQYLANQRQGTAKTKDRSEVSYSTKKQGRQKGGGGARHGSQQGNQHDFLGRKGFCLFHVSLPPVSLPYYSKYWL